MPWVKGQSGNLKGPPPKRNALARIIRAETLNGAELVEFSLKIMRDENAPLIARQAEKAWLADRGFGKAVETIVLEDEREGMEMPVPVERLESGLSPDGSLQ